MKKNIVVAFLLSMLAFPGAGHLYLKKFKTGWSISLITLCALIFVVYQIVKVILDAINEYAVGNISGDTGELAISVSKQLDSGPFDPIGLAMMILIFCWVAAMVDIVRIGISKKTPEPK